jgi:DNA-binding NtrC family response regulator
VRSVLFVDDDQDLLDAMKETLEYTGLVACVVARSLADLQQQSRQALPCTLALVDINLGDGEPSGIEVVRWLRGEGFSGDVVFLTGHAAGHPLVREAQRIQTCRVLSKPIDLEELQQLVDGAKKSPLSTASTPS